MGPPSRSTAREDPVRRGRTAVAATVAPNAWCPTRLPWSGDDDESGGRGRHVGAGAAGLLRAVGRGPQRRRRVPAGAGAAGSDPPAIPRDARALAARLPLGQGALRAAA